MYHSTREYAGIPGKFLPLLCCCPVVFEKKENGPVRVEVVCDLVNCGVGAGRHSETPPVPLGARDTRHLRRRLGRQMERGRPPLGSPLCAGPSRRAMTSPSTIPWRTSSLFARDKSTPIFLSWELQRKEHLYIHIFFIGVQRSKGKRPSRGLTRPLPAVQLDSETLLFNKQEVQRLAG